MKRSRLLVAAAVALASTLDRVRRPPLQRRQVDRARRDADSPWWRPCARRACRSTQCTIVLTRSTALETIRDGVAYPTTVTQAGRIVAFTVGLVEAVDQHRTTRKSYIHFLDPTYGGTTQVAITVLQAGRTEAQNGSWTGRRRRARVPRAAVPRARSCSSRSTTPLPVTPRRRGRADRPDVGAGPVDQPARQEVRLPPEPARELRQPAVQPARRS